MSEEKKKFDHAFVTDKKFLPGIINLSDQFFDILKKLDEDEREAFGLQLNMALHHISSLSIVWRYPNNKIVPRGKSDMQYECMTDAQLFIEDY